MRKVVSILIVLIPSYAMAAELRPDFLVLRQNHRMILVGPAQRSSFELTNYEPLFTWEGQHSKATFCSDTEGVNIEFKLDIVGPDWLFVTLAESEEGLFLTVRRTTTGGVDSDVDSCWYTNYDELMEDAKYGSSIAALMRRYGQNPYLPEVKCLRTTCFGLQPRPNADAEKECTDLLAMLNDDRWGVRDQAIRRLSNDSLAPYALALANRMKLTAEQRLVVNLLADHYSIEFGDELVNPLVSRVLADDDVAVVTE